MCSESYFIIYASGNKCWYKKGIKLPRRTSHRTDGPAIECLNGDNYWYIDNKLHREDGPAVEYANGDKIWFINDKEYSEEEYWRAIKLKVFI